MYSIITALVRRRTWFDSMVIRTCNVIPLSLCILLLKRWDKYFGVLAIPTTASSSTSLDAWTYGPYPLGFARFWKIWRDHAWRVKSMPNFYKDSSSLFTEMSSSIKTSPLAFSTSTVDRSYTFSTRWLNSGSEMVSKCIDWLFVESITAVLDQFVPRPARSHYPRRREKLYGSCTRRKCWHVTHKNQVLTSRVCQFDVNCRKISFPLRSSIFVIKKAAPDIHDGYAL